MKAGYGSAGNRDKEKGKERAGNNGPASAREYRDARHLDRRRHENHSHPSNATTPSFIKVERYPRGTSNIQPGKTDARNP